MEGTWWRSGEVQVGEVEVGEMEVEAKLGRGSALDWSIMVHSTSHEEERRLNHSLVGSPS